MISCRQHKKGQIGRRPHPRAWRRRRRQSGGGSSAAAGAAAARRRLPGSHDDPRAGLRRGSKAACYPSATWLRPPPRAGASTHPLNLYAPRETNAAVGAPGAGAGRPAVACCWRTTALEAVQVAAMAATCSERGLGGRCVASWRHVMGGAGLVTLLSPAAWRLSTGHSSNSQRYNVCKTTSELCCQRLRPCHREPGHHPPLAPCGARAQGGARARNRISHFTECAAWVRAES